MGQAWGQFPWVGPMLGVYESILKGIFAARWQDFLNVQQQPSCTGDKKYDSASYQIDSSEVTFTMKTDNHHTWKGWMSAEVSWIKIYACGFLSAPIHVKAL